QGYFQKEEDTDWYRLDFSKEGKHIIRLTLSGVSGFESKLSWLDNSGNEILRSDFGDEGQGEILTNIGVTPLNLLYQGGRLGKRQQSDSLHP
ncbi:MAG: hypothetical protein ACE5GI_05530, partial [Candidatus Aminicenantales bacterium]